MCKHNWVWLLPINDIRDEKKSLEYGVDMFISRVGDYLYCTKCGHTGHKIKSHRGGVRVHYNELGWAINKANEIRERYGFEKLNSVLNVKASVATDDDSSTKAG